MSGQSVLLACGAMVLWDLAVLGVSHLRPKRQIDPESVNDDLPYGWLLVCYTGQRWGGQWDAPQPPRTFTRSNWPLEWRKS